MSARVMRSVALILPILLLSVEAAPAVTPDLTVVALTGNQAPGFPAGTTYSSVLAGNSTNIPALDASGNIVYWGMVAPSNQSGIWADIGNAQSLLYQSGAQAPGTANGVTFSGFLQDVSFNGLDQIAFIGFLTGPGITTSDQSGIWSNVSGSLALVARAGSAAPGAGSQANFSSFGDGDRSSVALNNAGNMAFIGTLTGFSVTSSNSTGIWSTSGGNLALIARQGSPAPGTSAGTTFYSMINDRPSFSALGQVAFFGTLAAGNGVTLANDTGLWAQRNGSLVLIAREGSQEPGLPAGNNFGDFNPSSLKTPGFNSSGNVAFTASGNGIWSDATGSLVQVAGAGQAASGMPAGTTFSSFFGEPLLNDSGRVEFHAKVSGSSVTTANDTGIWVQRPSSLGLIVREGDQAPGLPAGVHFDDFVSFGVDGDVLNAAGRVAFFATVAGPGVTTSNDHGIWAQDPFGNLQLIAREGDQLQVAPGDFRTITTNGLRFAGGSGNEDGIRSGFNDRGQVAFFAFFTDDSSGLFISNAVVPEPSSVNLLIAGVLLGCGFQLARSIRHRRATGAGYHSSRLPPSYPDALASRTAARSTRPDVGGWILRE